MSRKRRRGFGRSTRYAVLCGNQRYSENGYCRKSALGVPLPKTKGSTFMDSTFERTKSDRPLFVRRDGLTRASCVSLHTGPCGLIARPMRCSARARTLCSPLCFRANKKRSTHRPLFVRRDGLTRASCVSLHTGPCGLIARPMRCSARARTLCGRRSSSPEEKKKNAALCFCSAD